MSDQTYNTPAEREEDKANVVREPYEQRTLKGGGLMLVAMGLVDVVSHMGVTGLVFGGIVSYAVYRHGPEVAALVEGEIGARDLAARLPWSKRANKPAPTASGERTFWQKAWNLPASEGAVTVADPMSPGADPKDAEIFAEEMAEDTGAPQIERITIEQASAHTERNSYEVYIGRSLTDEIGRACKISFLEKHMKFIGASQRGKSSMVAALLTAIAATHDPAAVQFAVLDFENITGRVLAALPHIKHILVRGADTRLHATTKAQVLEHLVLLHHYMEYRYTLPPAQRARLPLLIIYIEEFLRLRKELANRIKSATPGAQRERAQRDYTAFCEAIDALTSRGLKARMQLWLCAQVDYADRDSMDIRDALTNVTDGMAFGVKPSAAQAAGFTRSDLITENWKRKLKGRAVVETADCQDYVLALDFDLRARVAALDEQADADADDNVLVEMPLFERDEPVAIRRHNTDSLAYERDRERDEEDDDMEMDPPPMAALPLRGGPTFEDAYTAWQNGATSVAKLEEALHVTHHKAYSLYQELKQRRLI